MPIEPIQTTFTTIKSPSSLLILLYSHPLQTFADFAEDDVVSVETVREVFSYFAERTSTLSSLDVFNDNLPFIGSAVNTLIGDEYDGLNEVFDFRDLDIGGDDDGNILLTDLQTQITGFWQTQSTGFPYPQSPVAVAVDDGNGTLPSLLCTV